MAFAIHVWISITQIDKMTTIMLIEIEVQTILHHVNRVQL